MRIVKFEGQAMDDLQFWIKEDLKTVRKIFELLTDIRQSPFDGVGKPEPLKHSLKGFWSRRITREHRLDYKITGTEIIVASCRFHYE